MKRLVFAVAVLVAAILVWRFRSTSVVERVDPAALSPNDPSRPVQPQAPNPKLQTPAPQPKTKHPKLKTSSEDRSHLADRLNAPTTDIREDLRIVDEVIGAFRTNFPGDGNPVGSNAEITAVLTGANRLELALIPPDHPAINRAGELCDRWGTPFFFHAESGTRMEIRSAGPDRKLYTADDAVFAP